MTFLTVGEPLICLDSGSRRLDETSTLTKSVAGAECNVAVGLARLGHAASMIGRVGNDPLGREVRRCLRGEGVDVQHVKTDESRPTGLLLKERYSSGTADVYYYRDGSAGSALVPDDVPTDLTGLRHLHVTGITLVLGDGPREATELLMTRAREAGARVSLDANFRHKLASVDQLVSCFESAAALADDVLLGWGESTACSGTDDLDSLIDYGRGLGRDTVVLKMRSGGAIALNGDDVIRQEPCPATVVDPVGAGDGFAVGFIHERLLGSSLARSLQTGAYIASRVISVPGDYAGLPYLAEMPADSASVTRVTVAR